MIKAILVVGMLAFPLSSFAQSHPAHEDSLLLKAGIFALAGVGGGDIATTAQAAERGNFYEGNVLFRKMFEQPVILGLANGALTGAVIYTTVQWHRSDEKWKRTTAHILMPAWIAFRGYVVYRNYDLLKQHPTHAAK